MSIRSPRLFVVAALSAATVLLAPLALAQTPPIKPGLWEIKTEGQDQKNAQMAERMKNMTPEMRAQIEAAMKQRGVDVTASGATRVCFSKDSMDISQWKNQSSCKTDFTTRSGSTWKWHTVCAESVSDGEALFTNAEHYTINTSTTSSLSGQPKTTQRTMTATWVGGACGDLKPFTPPKR
jgi:Protein of unknown function (DUF3617)